MPLINLLRLRYPFGEAWSTIHSDEFFEISYAKKTAISVSNLKPVAF
jgi:hypothetical protein